MTNVLATLEKRQARRGLFQLAIQALEAQGWQVTRVPRGGKASLRQIARGKERHKVSIRTSQDAWIAFPRRSDGNWVTLDGVDFVVAVSFNDKQNPTMASVHMIPGDAAREHFNRAYLARKQAGYRMHAARGIWISLYEKESIEPVVLVGAGLGLMYPAIATHDLRTASLPVGAADIDDDLAEDDYAEQAAVKAPVAIPLTIQEAKRRLAESLGVPESSIKITVEH
jgi:hypothetical protein